MIKIVNSLVEIKQHKDDLKKEFLSLKTNTQASIRALEVSQQELTESQHFINTEFEDCKSNQKDNEEGAKSAEAKILNLNVQLQSLQETLRDEQSKINDLEQYGRRSMVEISNVPVKTEESMKSIITALATIMNVNSFRYDNDVDVAHRLNSKLSLPPIIVMFRSRAKRNEFCEKHKTIRNIALQDLEMDFQEKKTFMLMSRRQFGTLSYLKRLETLAKKMSLSFIGHLMEKYCAKKRKINYHCDKR